MIVMISYKIWFLCFSFMKNMNTLKYPFYNLQIHIMSLQVLSTIFALSIYFVIFSLLYSYSTLFSVEAQPSTISDHEFHGYIEQMIGHLDASILNVQNNNSILAVAHALHPIEEIVDVINSRLIQTNETLAKDFSSKLN